MPGGTVSQILFTMAIYLIRLLPDGHSLRMAAPYPLLEGAYLGLLGDGGCRVPPVPLPERLVSMALL